MDIPNRLPPPEKRKDKISKKHLRYISRLEKTRTKAAKREAFEKEVKDEERKSDHRANTVAIAKTMRKITQDLVKVRSTKHTVNKKRKLAPEMQLFQDSTSVLDGEFPMPCVYGEPSCSAAPEQDALTEDEIHQRFPHAVVWNELDYPPMIPHDDLWVFCFNCHRGLRSTAVRKFQSNPTRARGDSRECFTSTPIPKWLVAHEPQYCTCDVTERKVMF